MRYATQPPLTEVVVDILGCAEVTLYNSRGVTISDVSDEVSYEYVVCTSATASTRSERLFP